MLISYRVGSARVGSKMVASKVQDVGPVRLTAKYDRRGESKEKGYRIITCALLRKET